MAFKMPDISAAQKSIAGPAEEPSWLDEHVAKPFEQFRADYLAPVGEKAISTAKQYADIATGTNWADSITKKQAGAYTPNVGSPSGTEILARDFASPILGEKILPEHAYTPEQNLRGVNELELMYGEASPYIEAVSQATGAQPVQLGLYGRGIPAASNIVGKVLPGLTTVNLGRAMVPTVVKNQAVRDFLGAVGKNAIEGGLAGAASAATTPGAKVSEGAATGFGMGAAFSGAAVGGATIAKNLRPLVKQAWEGMTPHLIQNLPELNNEIVKTIINSDLEYWEAQNRVTAAKMRSADFGHYYSSDLGEMISTTRFPQDVRVKSGIPNRAKDFVPTGAFVVNGQIPGEGVGRVVGAEILENGQTVLAVRDTPLRNPGEARMWVRAEGKLALRYGPNGEAKLNTLSPAVTAAMRDQNVSGVEGALNHNAEQFDALVEKWNVNPATKMTLEDWVQPQAEAMWKKSPAGKIWAAKEKGRIAGIGASSKAKGDPTPAIREQQRKPIVKDPELEDTHILVNTENGPSVRPLYSSSESAVFSDDFAHVLDGDIVVPASKRGNYGIDDLFYVKRVLRDGKVFVSDPKGNLRIMTRDSVSRLTPLEELNLFKNPERGPADNVFAGKTGYEPVDTKGVVDMEAMQGDLLSRPSREPLIESGATKAYVRGILPKRLTRVMKAGFTDAQDPADYVQKVVAKYTPTLTVNRVANALNVTHEVAATVLTTLERAGKLEFNEGSNTYTRVSDRTLRNREVKLEPEHTAAKKDFIAWYKDPANGEWSQGIYRGDAIGKDGRVKRMFEELKGGESLLDLMSGDAKPAKQRIIYVDQSAEFRKDWIADSQLGELDGPGWTEPAPFWFRKDEDFVKNETQIAQAMKRAEKENLPVYLRQQFQDPVLSPFLRGNRVEKTAQATDTTRRGMLSAKAMQEFNVGALLERLSKATGDSIHGVQADLLAKIFTAPGVKTREAAWQALRDSNPGLAKQSEAFVRTIVAETQKLETEIAQLAGGKIMDMDMRRRLGLADNYQRTTYRNFFDKDVWAEHILKNPNNVLDKAMALMMKDTQGQYSSFELRDALSEALHHTDPINALKNQGTKVGSNMAKIFEAKQQLSPEYRALLGEETSGVVRAAITNSNLRTMKQLMTMGNSLAEVGLASPVKMGNLVFKLPDSPVLGKSAGMYTSKEFIDVFPTPSNVLSAVDELAHTLTTSRHKAVTGWKAMKTLYNPGSWVMNGLRNIPGAIYSGAIDPFHPLQTAQDFYEAVRLQGAYLKDPSIEGPAALLIEAQNNGGLTAGLARTELSHSKDRMLMDMLKHLEGDPDMHGMNILSKVREYIFDKGLKVHGDLKRIYDATDNTFKLAAYIHNRRMNLAEGQDVNSAALNASRTVRESFPVYDDPNRIAATMRRVAPDYVGVVAPFFTAATEDARVNATAATKLAKYLANPEDPTADKRIFKHVIAGALLFKGLKTMLDNLSDQNGVTPAEREAALKMRGYGTQQTHPFVVVAPYHDEQGRLEVYDLTTVFQPLMMMKNMKGNNPVAAFAHNLVGEFLGGQESPLASAAQGYLEKSGAVTPMFQDNAKLRLGEGAQDVALRNAKQLLLPGVVTRGLKAYDMATTDDRYKEQWTPRQAASYALGSPLEGPVSLKAGSGTSAQRTREIMAFLAQFNRELGPDLIRRIASGKLDRADVPAVIALKQRVKNERMSEYLDALTARAAANQGAQQ